MTMLTDLKQGRIRPLIDLTETRSSQAGYRHVWQISSLLSGKTHDGSPEYSVFSEFAALAKKAPCLCACLHNLAEAGWSVSYAQEAEEAELDFEDRHIELPGFGLCATSLNGRPLQKLLSTIASLKAFRLAEHQLSGLSEELLLLAPDQWLQFARAQNAEIDVFLILTGFQARTEKEGQALWRYLLSSDLYVLADNFARRMPLMHTQAHMKQGLSKLFAEWHQQAELVNASDRAALDRMDIILPHIAYPTRRMHATMLETLCTVYLEEADEAPLHYLTGIADRVLSMAECSTINDDIVAAHLFQIIEENAVYQQGAVAVRDPLLAKALFH